MTGAVVNVERPASPAPATIVMLLVPSVPLSIAVEKTIRGAVGAHISHSAPTPAYSALLATAVWMPRG